MLLNYNELVIFKNGETSYKSDVATVVADCLGCYEITCPGNQERVIIGKDRVDGGPLPDILFLHNRDALNGKKIESCFSDIRRF